MKEIKKLDPAERMIKSKRILIRNLQQAIKDENDLRNENIKRIEFRISQAKTILSALEKGTLQP